MADKQAQLLIDSGQFQGIDAWTSGYYVDQKRATDILNILPDLHLGSFNTVLGRSTLTTNPLPNAVLGLGKFQLQGASPQYIAATNEASPGTAGALYAAAAGDANWTKLTLPSTVTLTQNKPTSFLQGWSWMFGTNGTDTPWKIDSSLTVTAWQIQPPASAPTPTDSGGGGNLTGTYYYRCTFSNTAQESSPGPISAAVTVTAHSVNLASIPQSTDPQATTINIYRIGGTTSAWEFVGSVAMGTTTGNDNLADTAVGQNLVLHRDPPPSFWYILAHKSRVWGFGTSSNPCDLYYSNPDEPWGFDTTDQVIPIGRNIAGDIAVGLGEAGSVLICFKTMSTWAVYGTSSADFLTVPLFPIGCAAPRSIVSALGVVFWLGWNDAWMYDGAEPSRISPQIHSVINALSTNDKQRAAGAYRDGIWHLSFPTQGVTYSYVIGTKEWYKLGWAFEVVLWDDTNVEITGSRAGAGNVDLWFSATDDLGSSIVGTFQGKLEDSQHPEAVKRFRYLELMAPLQTGQEATLTLIADPGPAQKLVSRLVSLAGNTIRQQVSLPPTMLGYQGQLILTVTASGARVEIQKFQAWGWLVRRFAP